MPTTLYWIERDDTITEVNEQWDAFAASNQSPHLVGSAVIGVSLWHFISDAQTTHLYELLIGRVRESQQAIEVPFQCDAPDLKRAMVLRIVPEGERLRFEAVLLSSEARQPVNLLDVAASRAEDLLVMCSWCKGVKVSEDRWMTVEEAVVALRLFNAPKAPTISHGMCEVCFADITSQL